MIFSMCILLPVLKFSIGSDKPILELEKAYNAGQISNPIQAMIFFEKSKLTADNSLIYMFSMIFVFAIPMVVVYGGLNLLQMIYPAYNFYWGDYVTYFDKKKQIKNVFLTVVILGIIVSIISAYILKLLP